MNLVEEIRTERKKQLQAIQDFYSYQDITGRFVDKHPVQIKYSSKLNAYERQVLKDIFIGDLAAIHALSSTDTFVESLSYTKNNFAVMFREYQQMQTTLLKQQQPQQNIDSRTICTEPLAYLCKHTNQLANKKQLP